MKKAQSDRKKREAELPAEDCREQKTKTKAEQLDRSRKRQQLPPAPLRAAAKLRQTNEPHSAGGRQPARPAHGRAHPQRRGYEVVTVSNADSALIRLDDVDPDVVLADTVMPGRTGYEICQYLKMSPRHRHVRVILTAGVLETLDEAQASAGGGRRHAVQAVRGERPAGGRQAAGRSGRGRPGSGRGARGRAPGQRGAGQWRPSPFVAVVDAEQVRAAVTVALDAAMARWWTRSPRAWWPL